MPQGGVAFYNCGEHSGRSQPHKHMQVVPLPFIERQAEQCSVAPQPPIEPVVLAAQAAAGAAPLQPFELRLLPYRAYAVVVTPRCVGGTISSLYPESRCLYQGQKLSQTCHIPTAYQ